MECCKIEQRQAEEPDAVVDGTLIEFRLLSVIWIKVFYHIKINKFGAVEP